MAAGRVVGPEGLASDGGWDGDMDAGTLARTLGQVPGPICLYGSPNRLYDKASKKGAGGATKAAKKTPRINGIFVNPQSSIKAADWVAKIAANKNVEDYFKDQIHSADSEGRIYVTDAENFRFPSNVVAKFWLNDWLTAFVGMDWELTTGVLEISVTKPSTPPAAGVPPAIVGTVRPDLGSGEAVDNFTQAKALGQTGTGVGDFSVEFGSTVPDGIRLSSGRMTIVIATQVKMILGGKPGKTYPMTDDELVNTWFHEIACHAGRHALGSGKDLHGDSGVEATAKDIDAWIPGTQTLGKVFDDIKGFLSPPKSPSH